MRHAPRRLDDPPRVRRPRATACRPCRSSACTASSRPAPRSARPTRSSAPATASCSRRASRAASPAATACSPARSACPKSTNDRKLMMKCDMCYDRTERRQEADVRDRLPEPGAVLRHARADRAAAAAVGADQHVPVRQPDDHDAGQHDGARAASRRATPHVDVTAAMDEQPRSRAVSLKVVPLRGHAPADPTRSVRRGGGVSHGDEHASDPRARSIRGRLAGPRGTDRHGAGERLRAAARARADHASRRTARPPTQQPAWRQDFPDRLAAGPLRRAPRLHEVHGADQRWRSPSASSGSPRRTGGASARGQPRDPAHRVARRRRRSAARSIFTYPGEHDACVLVRLGDGGVRRLQPEVHAPVLRGDPAPERGRASLPVPRRATSTCATGRPIAGPPRRPLPRIVLEVRGGDIYATGVEERTV